MSNAVETDRSCAIAYLRWTLVGFFLVMALYVSTFVLSLNCRVSTGLWTVQRLAIKREALDHVDPKLVLVGGSNVLYGFSAAQLAEQHALPSINAGTHVGLGITYILHDARRYLAPGRVIVLALEYHLYADGYHDPALADQIVGFEPATFWQLDMASQAHLVFGLPLAQRLRYLRAAFGKEKHEKYADADARSMVNASGDQFDNDSKDRTPAMLAEVQATKLQRFVHGALAWSQIAAFAADARRIGAKVVIAHPNIYFKTLGAGNGAFLAQLQRRADELGIPLVGRAEDYTFGDERVWNSRYHQTRQGQQLSTERLYRDLTAAGLL